GWLPQTEHSGPHGSAPAGARQSPTLTHIQMKTKTMKLFKLIASKAGKVVFDDRIEADTPRTAREQMKSLLGLQSLTGVVYSITEIPVELIREIVATKVLEIVGNRRNGGSSIIDVSKIVGDAAN